MKDNNTLTFAMIAAAILIIGLLMFYTEGTGRYTMTLNPANKGLVIFDTKTSEIEVCIPDDTQEAALVCAKQTKRKIN